MLPSYTILCHSNTPCSLKVVVIIIGGAEIGFEDVLVVVGGKTVEINVMELLQTFIQTPMLHCQRYPHTPPHRYGFGKGIDFCTCTHTLAYPWLLPAQVSVPVLITIYDYDEHNSTTFPTLGSGHPNHSTMLVPMKVYGKECNSHTRMFF